jgi:hypothetical protein
LREHVVVCGLGNVGIRLAQRLAEQGVPVVGIERDDDGRHVAAARRMGIPVVIGDATLTETLHAAQVQTAQAVVATTDSDVVDLQAAVNARALHPSVRIILRLFDHDLSTAVERRFDIRITRSTGVIAAPVFATAMLGSRGGLGRTWVESAGSRRAHRPFSDLIVAPPAEPPRRHLASTPAGVSSRRSWPGASARRRTTRCRR